MDGTRPQVKASLYLEVREDKRTKKQKANSTYAVKVRLWDSTTQSRRLRHTGIEMSKADFEAAMKPRPKAAAQKNRALLNSVLAKFTDAIEELDRFNFEELDTMVGTPKEAKFNVFWYYEQRIDQFMKSEQLGSAESYQYSSAAIREYWGRDNLQFASITPRFLQGFEDYMVEKGNKLTTVGIYLRNLRAVYRRGFSKDTFSATYPFGAENEGKYEIPNGSNPKKALEIEQIRKLLDAQPANEAQARAKDFLLFSYFGNGMNMRDITLLTFDSLSPNASAPEKFSFIREKTKRKRKGSSPPRPIDVYMNDHMLMVYHKYRNDTNTSNYVFPVLNNGMTAGEKRKNAMNFTRSINQNIQKLCEANGLPSISTYWARHSFITHLIQHGSNREMVAELAGHKSSTTTMGYFAGQRDDAKRKAVAALWID